LIRAVLAAFPGATIQAVRDLAPAESEAAADDAADAPAEDTGEDAGGDAEDAGELP
jgi:hypothetical protein